MILALRESGQLCRGGFAHRHALVLYPDFTMQNTPDSYSERFARAVLSLHGLAIGDGLGEMMFGRADQAYDLIMQDRLPAGPWFRTDDTEMAISIVETLRLAEAIDQEMLAKLFHGAIYPAAGSRSRQWCGPSVSHDDGWRRMVRRLA